MWLFFFFLRNFKQHRYGFCTGFAKHFAKVPGKGVLMHHTCSSTHGKESKEESGRTKIPVLRFSLGRFSLRVHCANDNSYFVSS